MKLTLTLPDALHARPANLLVRLASMHASDIQLRKGSFCGSAKNILDVLSLGAAKGDVIVLEIAGTQPDEEAAAKALRELIERNFDSDLVPETGTAGAAGIAMGKAVLSGERTIRDAPVGTPAEEEARARAAFARVEADVGALVVGLPASEANLFAPEIAIVQALLPRVLSRVASGARVELAVAEETLGATTDLLTDARTRLFEALGEAPLDLTFEGEVIVVTDELTPSLVARLPSTVGGIVAGLAEDAPAGFTSHAAILARGRQIPLAFVQSHVTAGIEAGDSVLLDTTEAPARVWVAPSEALVASARTKRDELAEKTAAAEARARVSLSHLGVSVRVNVGAREDAIPSFAEGIGLLRTELLFAGRKHAPSEAEQLAALLSIARKSSGPIVARLFDAGGDKPLEWLSPPSHARDARGIGLLLQHEAVLFAQLRALGRARPHADVRVLLPLVCSEHEVHAVRAKLDAAVPVGAMVETAAAVAAIDPIAEAADFVCVGTNDLAADVLGVKRADSSLSLDPRVIDLVGRIVRGAHARKKQVTVCGEMAADERGARILVGLGVDALSVPPARVAPVRVLLSETTRQACEELAREALRA